MGPCHPAVSLLPIDQPSSDLAQRLNQQQAAETLADLEDGRAVSQQFIPAADGDGLQQAIGAKDPLPQALVLGSLATKGALDPSRSIVRVDGKLVQAPDQKDANHQPLGPGEQLA